MSAPTNQHFAALFGAIACDAYDLKAALYSLIATVEGSEGSVLAAAEALAGRIGATADRALTACGGDAIPVMDDEGWLFTAKALEALEALGQAL